MPQQRQDYEKYIRSDVWSARRKLYFARHARCCAVCKTKEGVHLHLSYSKMGKEPDVDLIPLCKFHHEAVHTFHKQSELSLRRATQLFVASGGTPGAKTTKLAKAKFPTKPKKKKKGRDDQGYIWPAREDRPVPVEPPKPPFVPAFMRNKKKCADCGRLSSSFQCSGCKRLCKRKKAAAFR